MKKFGLVVFVSVLCSVFCWAKGLSRGLVAVSFDGGVFVSWRLLPEDLDGTFDLYKNGKKLNNSPLAATNYTDISGCAGDVYAVHCGDASSDAETCAVENDYISVKVQKPNPRAALDGTFSSYTMNDASVGDLDGDGELEVIIKWYPDNAIDSSKSAFTSPTLFDAYKLDGTPLWRIDLGLSLTSGAHYNQIVVADFNGDGKCEVFLKTGDGTKVYGVKKNLFNEKKAISTIGNKKDEGAFILKEGKGQGHITGGNEYVSFFDGKSGKVLATVPYAFPVGDVTSWGDNYYNRSDRWNAGCGVFDGKTTSAFLGRGYYGRTAYAAYNLTKKNKIEQVWTFDTKEMNGKGASMGNHNIAVADVDGDGCDEIITGSLVLDHDGSILYVMDGENGREMGSHGDALHLGKFFPDDEKFYVWQCHEVKTVASLELHEACSGKTVMSFFANKDAGRAIAANITKNPGFEMWGTGGKASTEGGGLYNCMLGSDMPLLEEYRKSKLSVNFHVYWDGDFLHELLDGTQDSPLSVTKYNEETESVDLLKAFDGTHSNNGTKANPSLCADIIGDWREEVIVPSSDDSELRIYTTTIPTDHRLVTLMSDHTYLNSVITQNNGYNQPTNLGFYLGEER